MVATLFKTPRILSLPDSIPKLKEEQPAFLIFSKINLSTVLTRVSAVQLTSIPLWLIKSQVFTTRFLSATKMLSKKPIPLTPNDVRYSISSTTFSESLKRKVFPKADLPSIGEQNVHLNGHPLLACINPGFSLVST